MKHWRIAWWLITDRSFRWALKDVLVYALTGYDRLRGEGASDVLHFHLHWERFVFDKHSLRMIEYERTNFQLPEYRGEPT